MAQTPEGYSAVSEADQQRAEKLFASAAKVASAAQWDYAIELYIQGLTADPENINAHRKLRELSLQRKLKGGKPMGMLQRAKLKKGKSDQEQMLYYEKLLAFDPPNMDYMKGLMTSARKAGYFGTCLWIGPILFKTNTDGKQDFSTFVTLKDEFKAIKAYKLAIDAAGWAFKIKPENSDLNHEMKQLATLETMQRGNYESADSFVDSIRNKAAQQDLMDKDKGVLDAAGKDTEVAKAKAAYEDDPEESGKLWAYVDALARTEKRDNESLAVELLEKAFEQTDSYRYRRRANEIKLRQTLRMEQQLKDMAKKAPDDKDLQKDYQDIKAERAEQELAAAREAAKAYPQDNGLKFDIGSKLYELGRHDEAIPMFQQAVNDPKKRDAAKLLLGRSFLQAGFNQEAAETLAGLIEDYQFQDEKALDMQYWYGRALEETGDGEAAGRAYSKVAQSDFNYRDTRDRLAKLRKRA